jgi:hypothetical protein
MLDTQLSCAVHRHENACSPRDVGGAPGYEESLEALAVRDHASAQISRNGSDFDPRAFDIDGINARLDARK